MKRKNLCLLFVCCLLYFAGCQKHTPLPLSTKTSQPSTESTLAVNPAEGTTEMITVEVIGPQSTATEYNFTEPQMTETPPIATKPTDSSMPNQSAPNSSATVPPELPTEETVPPTTEPEQTQPAETDPSEPEASEPIPLEAYPSEPKAEQIDTAALEAYGRSYASSTYGYNGTSACNPSTEAGYFPGATKEILTMEDGYSLVRQAVDSQYRRDIAYGYSPYEEIDGVIVRCPINIRIEATGQPNVYVIWVYYGGDA